MKFIFIGLITIITVKSIEYYMTATKEDSIDTLDGYYDDNQGLRPKYLNKGGK